MARDPGGIRRARFPATEKSKRLRAYGPSLIIIINIMYHLACAALWL